MKSGSELPISADSHVIEPPELWSERLPPSLRDQAPRYPQHPFQAREGGSNPTARVKEMAMDGVSGEVLYASLALNQFGRAGFGPIAGCQPRQAPAGERRAAVRPARSYSGCCIGVGRGSCH